MLGDPDVTQDTKRFTKLMKEQAELAPIVEAYKQYKMCIRDSGMGEQVAAGSTKNKNHSKACFI